MKKKQNRRVGPSGSVAELSEAIKKAPKAPPANLAELLDEHRKHKGQDKVVAMTLFDAFTYLAYRRYAAALGKGRRDADDLLGELFLDLGKCIERLAENDVPPERVESYIKCELHHSREHLTAADTIRLDPPASTVTDRRKKGLEPLPEPVRVRSIRATRWEPNPEFPTSPLADPAYAHEVQPKYGTARVPSRFDQPPIGNNIDDEDSYTFLADVLVNAAETPLERTVAGMLLTGHSGNEIARSLKVPRNQIANVIGVLRARVGPRVGIEFEVTPAEPLTGRPAPEVVLDLPVSRSSSAPAGCEAARQAVEQMAV